MRRESEDISFIALLVISASALSACGSPVASESAGSSATYELAAPRIDEAQVPSSDPVGEPDKVLEPAKTYSLDINTHCGAAVLSRTVDGSSWRTDEADGMTGDWTPQEWMSGRSTGNPLLTVLVVLSGDKSQLTVTYGERAVVYRRVTASDPEILCA